MPDHNDLSHSELTIELRGLLEAQTRLLDGLIQKIVSPKAEEPRLASEIALVVPMMIQSLGVSSHSILRLSETIDMAMRDCFGIARSSCELAVNVCFIAASEPAVAERARRHASQRLYRSKGTQRTIAGMRFHVRDTALPEAATIPGLAEALREFEGKKGYEQDWTPVKVEKRIEKVKIVSSAAAISLAGSVFAIYKNASELLHGSFAGVTYFWSASNMRPATTKATYRALWEEHFQTVFTATFFAVDAVLQLLSTQLSIMEINDAAAQLRHRLSQLLGEVGPQPTEHV